jgi:glycosyltransferase involved in cell wall biosynthesis
VETDPAFLPGADIAILHAALPDIDRLLDMSPLLQTMRVLAYCVWEFDRLPRAHITGLGRVSAIWTCSRYSQRAFLEYFPSTAVVPHVVTRRKVSADLLAEARNRIGGADPEEFLFFSVVDSVNPRKNIQGLLWAFSRVRAISSRKVRLILKQYRMDLDFSSLDGVCGLGGDLSPEEMSALHLICHAYVSAHHAEGWGLGLSEAMAYGKPVIATGFSGNMEFMNEGNSFPVPFSLAPVSDNMTKALADVAPDMIWADIDTEALILTMKRVAEGRYDPLIPRRAAEITRTFGPRAVAEIIRGLL